MSGPTLPKSPEVRGFMLFVAAVSLIYSLSLLQILFKPLFMTFDLDPVASGTIPLHLGLLTGECGTGWGTLGAAPFVEDILC